ncbi:MAG TPA: BON domain-containing protein [Candidatus Sulfotelmatobacter sp.]|nr:BON domain-containing protein [Candidatus Sulfotelmatobacter sp.]
MTNNDKLKADVLEELAWDPTVDATHVGVSVNKGIVTLMGHVGTFPQKYAAELAVRRVRGVRAIAQEIEVHLPEHKKHADDEIAERALKILAWDAEVPSDRVQVKVERGYVTLTGEVDWNHEKIEIERLIRKLSGVTGLRNAIVVKPRVSPSDVRQRIRQALERDAAVEASAISVATVGSKVVLTGIAHGYAERDAIERAAWSAPGVTGVEDHITVK